MSLRSFLEEMEKTREIVYVREEVSPRFEIPSITKAFEGESLFFDKVKDYENEDCGEPLRDSWNACV